MGQGNTGRIPFDTMNGHKDPRVYRRREPRKFGGAGMSARVDQFTARASTPSHDASPVSGLEDFEELVAEATVSVLAWIDLYQG